MRIMKEREEAETIEGHEKMMVAEACCENWRLGKRWWRYCCYDGSSWWKDCDRDVACAAATSRTLGVEADWSSVLAVFVIAVMIADCYCCYCGCYDYYCGR